jgi:hypothetical protein
MEVGFMLIGGGEVVTWNQYNSALEKNTSALRSFKTPQ